MSKAVIADKLPHACPVLLLAMRVVILAIGLAACPGQLGVGGGLYKRIIPFEFVVSSAHLRK
jgi:hypothetical protein